MHRVAEYATLNANYLMAKLREAGFDLAFPERRASHEFIVSLKKLKDATGVSAMDFANACSIMATMHRRRTSPCWCRSVC